MPTFKMPSMPTPIEEIDEYEPEEVELVFASANPNNDHAEVPSFQMPTFQMPKTPPKPQVSPPPKPKAPPKPATVSAFNFQEHRVSNFKTK